jgi:hypothetical protein
MHYIYSTFRYWGSYFEEKMRGGGMMFSGSSSIEEMNPEMRQSSDRPTLES